jgi:hypothetical protein
VDILAVVINYTYNAAWDLSVRRDMISDEGYQFYTVATACH